MKTQTNKPLPNQWHAVKGDTLNPAALREVLADLVAFHYGNPSDEELERMADKYDAADIPDSRTLELNMAAHARALLESEAGA